MFYLSPVLSFHVSFFLSSSSSSSERERQRERDEQEVHTQKLSQKPHILEPQGRKNPKPRAKNKTKETEQKESSNIKPVRQKGE